MKHLISNMNKEINEIYSGYEFDKSIEEMSKLINEAITEMNSKQTILPNIARNNIASVSNMLTKNILFNKNIFFI